MRQQFFNQLGGRTGAKRPKAKLFLAFDRLTLAAPLGGEVVVDHIRQNLDLVRDESQQRRRWPLAGAQRTAGKTQVAKHERVAEAVVVAAAAPDRCKVGGGQGEVAHQFALICRRVEQLRNLDVTQSLPSRHSCLLDLGPGRPADPGERVDQRAALDAEGAADRGLGGAAVKRRNHRR